MYVTISRKYNDQHHIYRVYKPERNTHHHSARLAHTASQGTSCYNRLNSTSVSDNKEVNKYLSRCDDDSHISNYQGWATWLKGRLVGGGREAED